MAPNHLLSVPEFLFNPIGLIWNEGLADVELRTILITAGL